LRKAERRMRRKKDLYHEENKRRRKRDLPMDSFFLP
jgi:hypothetical protein